jgi:rhodanese-related sulfurtransferase
MSAIGQRAEIEVEPSLVAGWLGQDAELQLIDVRETHEYEAGHIDRARHLELTELTARAGTVERERPVVFYCRVGTRSEMAAQAFRASGFDAYTMTGGLVRWAEEGRALSPADGYVADH